MVDILVQGVVGGNGGEDKRSESEIEPPDFYVKGTIFYIKVRVGRGGVKE